MSIMTLNENTLSKNEIREYYNIMPWAFTVTDDSKELNNKKGIIIDMSKCSEDNSEAYFDKLINAVNNIQGEGTTCIVPVEDWSSNKTYAIYDQRSNNPISYLYDMMKNKPDVFKSKFSGYDFIFCTYGDGYFRLTVDKFDNTYPDKFKKLIDSMISKKTAITTSALTGTSEKLTAEQIEEKRKNAAAISGTAKKPNPVKTVNTKNNKKEELKEKKEELAKHIYQAAEDSETEEEVMDVLDADELAKQLIIDLAAEDDGNINMSKARASRITKVNEEFMKKKFGDRSVKDILESTSVKELPSTNIKIDTINKEWEDLKFVNFEKSYDFDADIIKILNSFKDMSYPVVIRNINVEDTSTSEDYIDTYIVDCEDGFGKRFALKFDMPKFINNRFMRLRGNNKILGGQLLLLPCIKTEEDTVQIVSNYNKIFVRRYGFAGKSFSTSDRMIKAIKKMQSKDFKITWGDNTKICSKYELPIDYIDMASEISRIDTKNYTIIFDQDYIRANCNIDLVKGLPYGINKATGEIIYYNSNNSFSFDFYNTLKNESTEFDELFLATKPANRLVYSKASILSNEIPLIILLGYQLGLNKALKDSLINYRISEKKNYDPLIEDYIRFNDGYLVYTLNYSASMIMNGLKECDTADYSLGDVNDKYMWLDFLDEFGGRILADGLDNFNDLMMDPITKEICNTYMIPDTYTDILIYASNLLADNKYNRHVDITGNRYRSNEVVAGYVYKALANSYKEYKLLNKRGRKTGMTIKRSAVIDLVMLDPMFSDLSILNPLLEVEAANTVSFKGLSGMNSDRAYSLDKRTYDETMINKLAFSTGFSANVGISRQTTIDMDIKGVRGYIKDSRNIDNIGITKTFSITEALTPFGTTRDDPFRSAMTFIQTSKHSMRTDKSMPLLITNGADEALPYISSDNFAFKAKENGKIVELTENHMIIEYKTGKHDYIDLSEKIEKNSDGGFFVTLKLDTDLKQGQSVKAGEVIAYDKKSFSRIGGATNNLAYNLGVLAKVAIINTDEGFEDSTIVSDWMSEALASDIVLLKDISLAKSTNVYNMVKKGQPIQEGEPLIIFQNAFDEEDANMLLKTITDEELVSDLGRIRVKSKVTGVIEDVKIYRTAKLEECSESLQKIIRSYERNVKEKKSLYKKYDIEGINTLPADYELEQTGKLKDVNDGILIEFYIKYHDKFSVGDKNVAQSAAKGVTKAIFPKGKEPWSEYRPEENIHGMYSVGSFNARMITSVLVSGAINKAMIELDRQVKETMGIPIKYLEDIE